MQIRQNDNNYFLSFKSRFFLNIFSFPIGNNLWIKSNKINQFCHIKILIIEPIILALKSKQNGKIQLGIFKNAFPRRWLRQRPGRSGWWNLQRYCSKLSWLLAGLDTDWPIQNQTRFSLLTRHQSEASKLSGAILLKQLLDSSQCRTNPKSNFC